MDENKTLNAEQIAWLERNNLVMARDGGARYFFSPDRHGYAIGMVVVERGSGVEIRKSRWAPELGGCWVCRSRTVPTLREALRTLAAETVLLRKAMAAR